MPSVGMDRQQYLSNKFGSEDNANSVYQRIADEGEKNKIFFQFNKIAKTPNSFLSHKLLAYAHNKNKQTKVLELLFYKYFIEGEDIGRVFSMTTRVSNFCFCNAINCSKMLFNTPETTSTK